MASENENENRETLADVVAEKRARANEIEGAAGRDSNQFQRELIRDLRAEADRIAAAAKRDEERVIEHATRHAEAVARDNCRDCVHNPKGENYEGGNAAAMREVLEGLNSLFESGAICTSYMNTAEETWQIEELYRKAQAALALPPRQCDVGTAEEHAQRFYNFCESNSSGINGMCKQTCPCIDCFDKCQCLTKWAQMPFEAEEGGAK